MRRCLAGYATATIGEIPATQISMPKCVLRSWPFQGLIQRRPLISLAVG